MPTRNPHHGAEKNIESLWHHRVVCCSSSLPFSTSFQCSDLYQLPGKAYPKLVSLQNLSDPGQRFLPQRRRCLGLVFQTSQEYRGLQSAPLLPSIQCLRKSLALYAHRSHSQPLFRDSRRIVFNFNLDISQYTKSSLTDSRLSAPISINSNNIMSLYLCNAI